jgi:crotonobetainyl-CoA:carnitine CoA-transferase CaiB-like acyl-CoA transferase
MAALLDGIRVIEFGLLLNGGTVGMYLADLGAEVIKLEDVGRGDYIRTIMGQISPGRSPVHLQINKGKKSLALNLKSAEGRSLFFELLKTADIFIDGMRPGTAESLGIGYAEQQRAKPDIVYVQYTGYGADGPYARIPTHGYQMNALVGGLPSKMGEDGLLHRVRGVQYLGGTEESSAATALGAQFATMSAMAALTRRLRTGEGAYIDVASSDAVMATAWMGMIYNLNYDRIDDRQGLGERTGKHEAKWPEGSTRYQLYLASDGKPILLGLIEPKFWRSFCEAVERVDLADTMLPGLDVDYGADKPWLRRELQLIVATRTSAQWMELAIELGLPIGPAPALEDAPDDPHVRSRGLLQETDIGGDGSFTYVGFPAKIDGETQAEIRPAPEHGAHSAAILEEFGIDPMAFARLKAAGVVR